MPMVATAQKQVAEYSLFYNANAASGEVCSAGKYSKDRRSMACLGSIG
jgi:hypothetical protein